MEGSKEHIYGPEVPNLTSNFQISNKISEVLQIIYCGINDSNIINIFDSARLFERTKNWQRIICQ